MWFADLIGWSIVEVGDQGAIAWALFMSGEKRALLLQLTYRGGPEILLDPSDELIETCRKDAWAVWNDERMDPRKKFR